MGYRTRLYKFRQVTDKYDSTQLVIIWDTLLIVWLLITHWHIYDFFNFKHQQNLILLVSSSLTVIHSCNVVEWVNVFHLSEYVSG